MAALLGRETLATAPALDFGQRVMLHVMGRETALPLMSGLQQSLQQDAFNNLSGRGAAFSVAKEAFASDLTEERMTNKAYSYLVYCNGRYGPP